MDLLLAEDLMLLLLDDETGAVRQTHVRPLLGGAVLADLALAGAVEVEEKRGVWHTAKVHPVDGARPSDALLAAAYDEVAAKPRSAQDLVNRIGKPLKDDVTEVREGFECGINLGSYQDVKVDDVIETFEMREKKRPA